MREPAIAAAVAGVLHSSDRTLYDLLAFSIMPNHVHALLTPLPKDDRLYHALPAIMHTLKRRSAWDANALLGRRGPF